MTIDEYQSKAMRTVAGMNYEKYSTPEECLLINGVMGLNGEAGECIDSVKKYLFQGHALDKEHIAEELGDVAWYLAITAHAIGYDLSEILNNNIVKLLDRYPDGFSADKSINRN